MKNTSEPQIVKVNIADRWQIYYRLKALNIECTCQTERPLMVYPNSPQDAAQIWSVTKRFSANRRELIDWLDRCWQIESCK